MNEQEHNREATQTVSLAYSANLADQTMHELYLWFVSDFNFMEDIADR
jgi:hypothetical protein